MQLFINNWSAVLTAPATASAVSLSVPLADAAKLTGLGAGDHYLLTLAALDGSGIEIAWEIVKVTDSEAGILTVQRGQEGTTALDWASASVISARATKGTLEELRAGGGTAVGNAAPQPLGTPAAGTAPAASREDHVHAKPSAADIGAATAAQGAKADTAVQPAALASGLASKVDKDGTKVLSDQNYTAAEKAKLAGIEAAHFKGLHASLAALQAAHPTADAGNYADVDSGAGADVARYIWDVSDSKWLIQSGATGSMTAAQIKTAYESNPDTNAFSDTEQAKLGAIASGATANATNAELRDRSTHTGSQLTATISDFAETVRATVLTGLSLASGAAIAAGDSALVAWGKLQKQITDLAAAVSGKQETLVSGTNIKTLNGSSLLGTGNLDIAVGGMTNPMTTAGDLIVGGAGGVPARLPAGTNAHVLTMVAGAPVWGPPSSAAFTGGTLTSALNEAPPVTLASGGTVPIGAASANSITISGTTTVTAFDTIAAGAVRHLVFTGVLTLTHNATSLILPTAANISTASGDAATFESLGGGNWRCTSYMRASGAALLGGGGGLTNLTETKTTAAPNATVPVVSLSVSITEAHGDAAFCPKGNGALLADIPTGTTAGGNKRGINAVDLQFSRSAATHVASGDYSTISGGDGNTASGAYSTVDGGNANTASGNFSYVGGGTSNSATTNFSTVPGGQGCTASGLHATSYGQNNLSDGAGAGAYGIDSWSRGVQGACSYAAGMFYVRGDAQRVQYVLRKQTTNATPRRLAADGTNSSSQYQITLPNNGANAFSGSVVARSSTGDLVSAWEFKGAIKRGASAGTTALVGTPTVTLLGQDAGASAWAFAITADTTTGCIAFTATGAAATSIQWVAEVSTAEVNW